MSEDCPENPEGCEYFVKGDGTCLSKTIDKFFDEGITEKVLCPFYLSSS